MRLRHDRQDGVALVRLGCAGRLQVDAAAQDVHLTRCERRQGPRTGACAEQQHQPAGQRGAVHGAPERHQLGNFEHPLARPGIREVTRDDVRDGGQLAAPVGTANGGAQRAQGALDVRVAVAAATQLLDERLLPLRGQLGNGEVAEALDTVAERSPLHVGAGDVLSVLQPIALDHGRHGDGSGVGIAQFVVLGDVAVEGDFGFARVASAEAVALDLAASSIVAAGVIATVGSAPEEPAWHRACSS